MQKDRRGRLQGPRALLLAGGEAALLSWPLVPRTNLRKAIIDARWIAPGYHPPAWGRDPPIVAPQLAGALAKTGEQTDKSKKPEQEQQTTTVTVMAQDPDLPVLPGQQAEQETPTPAEKVSGAVLEHVLDAAMPGAALAAKILGLVTDASPATPTGQPTQITTVTKRQGQETEQEPEDEDEQERDE